MDEQQKVPGGVPNRVRLRGYRADLIARGGRRTTVDLEPELVAALEKIMARDGGTMREAINRALMAFAEQGGGETPPP